MLWTSRTSTQHTRPPRAHKRSPWRILAGSTALMAVGALVHAKPRQQALEAIRAGDLRAAKGYLQDLDDYLGKAKKEIPANAVGYRYQTEALFHHARGKESDTIDALRQACVVHPGGAPNEAILGDGPLVDMYYAVCREVEQRSEIDLAALKLPEAPVRIDGLVPGEEFPVREGRHLVQVQCADSKWSTMWSDLSAPADWAHGCADGALAAAEAPVSDDPMDDVPFFGDGDLADTTEVEDDGVEAVAEANPAPKLPPPPPPPPPPAAAKASPAPEPAAATPTSTDGPLFALEVHCTPGPCTVTLDGTDHGSTKLELQVTAGEHKLALEGGGRTLQRTLKISDNHTATILRWNHSQNSVEMDYHSAE
jgi:hypothetical protein